MSAPADFVVELIRSEPDFIAPIPTPATPIDLTDRTSIEDLGTINRAIDRDLLTFKTGDVTLGFWNADAYMDDLFAHFSVADRWQLRIWRRGEIQFWGVIVGHGSIRFDRKEKTCEITVYGLTRMLNDVSAETVARTFTLATLSGVNAAGATTLNVNSTTNLLPKDVLHLRNAAQNLTEDVTIKYVNSATQVTLEAALVNTYAANDVAECTTPFYRYKTLRFLVESLLTAGGFPLADYRMSRSVFNTAGPAPISHGGLGIVRAVWSPAAERNGRAYVVVDTLGTYYQPTSSPDADWMQEDALLRPWMDWSRYRRQIDGAPNIILRFPDNAGAYLTGGFDEWMCGVDDRDATTKYIYRARLNVGQPQLVRNSTTDGTTWSGWADFGAAAGSATSGTDFVQAEVDQVRGQVYVAFGNGAVTAPVDLWMYDIGAATWTRVNSAALQAAGLRYIRERDYVLGAYEAAGGILTFAAYRNGQKIFERSAGLPTYIRAGTILGFPSNPGYVFPTMGARYVDGKIYFSAVYDNSACQVSSADDFTTAKVRKYVAGTFYAGGAFGSRVADAMRWFPHSSNSITARAYHASAAFYAGVIAYADFEGKSCAEALRDLAILTNALFWIDDSGGAHFVARDLYDPGAVLPLDADSSDDDRRDMDRVDDKVWEETVSYIEVSGGGFSAVSGEADFAASGLSVDSPLIPNEAFCQALADALYDFYGRLRAFVEMNVRDPDGIIYRPLDRKTLDGIRYLVYESDHNLAEDEVGLKLLEDVA